TNPEHTDDYGGEDGATDRNRYVDPPIHVTIPGFHLNAPFCYLPNHSQTVLDVEDSGHLARAHFGNLAVRCAVDNSEEHRSAVLHDDVDGIAPDRLHAGE